MQRGLKRVRDVYTRERGCRDHECGRSTHWCARMWVVTMCECAKVFAARAPNLFS